MSAARAMHVVLQTWLVSAVNEVSSQTEAAVELISVDLVPLTLPGCGSYV